MKSAIILVSHLAMAHRDGKITIEALYAAPFSFRTRLLEMIQSQPGDRHDGCQRPTKLVGPLKMPDQAVVRMNFRPDVTGKTVYHCHILPHEDNGMMAKMRVQLIRLGWPLQVQLPGNPAVWTFDAKDSDLIEPRGRTMVYSPTRIEGTQSLFVFDFALPSTAKPGDHGTIPLSTTELPQSLKNVMPNGVFVVEFAVIAAND
ncbi:multicopper oxidase domain-containing protein [Pseudosulfitobacter sp. SM2401]|uniref:multicopper oxidase domain-containing protein n=1 Tax=Pseudosulfitobacter sp. SM2401 TaxID=3350098 RepID=UPI0036F30E74